jgi:hypothetical protein
MIVRTSSSISSCSISLLPVVARDLLLDDKDSTPLSVLSPEAIRIIKIYNLRGKTPVMLLDDPTLVHSRPAIFQRVI